MSVEEQKQSFGVQWPDLGDDGWAEYESRANGERLCKVDGVWWRAVRALFFRPLNVLRTYPTSVTPPALGLRLGAIQYPVGPEEATRSTIRLLLSDDARSYDAEGLASPVQRNIRKGMRHFQVRRLENEEVLMGQGHRVYTEFQSRTGYEHLKERVRPEAFARWARILMSMKGLVVLGAFAGERLSAVAITFRSGNVVSYNSYFGDEMAQANRGSDLMLHTVREAASRDPKVQTVFAATAGMPRGLDEFYCRRGFKVVARPAVVRGNPLALGALRIIAPSAYRKLLGVGADGEPEGGADWNAESARAFQ